MDEQPVNNDLAVITPYVVTFRGFTPELASVLGGFAASPQRVHCQGHQCPAGECGANAAAGCRRRG
jgi:hypothetical protein